MENSRSAPAAENRNYLALGRSQPIRSEALFLRGDDILIAHQDEHYHLRRTHNGKLILTK